MEPSLGINSIYLQPSVARDVIEDLYKREQWASILLYVADLEENEGAWTALAHVSYHLGDKIEHAEKMLNENQGCPCCDSAFVYGA